MPYDPASFQDPDHVCYACGNEYDYVGDEERPCVCPNCGQRGVSLDGRGEVVRTEDLDSLGGGKMVELYLDDGSDRTLRYYFSEERDPDRDGMLVRLTAVKIEDTRLTPESEHWSADLIPDVVEERLDPEKNGYAVTIATPSGSESDSRGHA